MPCFKLTKRQLLFAKIRFNNAFDKSQVRWISTECIDTKNSSYHNVKVGNVTFDFACEKKQAVYAYYDITPGGKLTQKLWNEIENSTTKKRPFYENEYVICTVNRVPDSFWTLSKRYDNVHIVSQKMLFATYKKEYNKIAHPRFVPSFVWRNWIHYYIKRSCQNDHSVFVRLDLWNFPVFPL